MGFLNSPAVTRYSCLTGYGRLGLAIDCKLGTDTWHLATHG